jgi:glycosyltransferase involved in cell wall biosynthesis
MRVDIEKELETVAIIPAFNEARTIGSVVNAALRANHVDAVVAVDDGSTDDTLKILGDIQSSSSAVEIICIEHHRVNQGKTESLITGVNKAMELGGNVLQTLVFLDADLSPIWSRNEGDNRKLWSRRIVETNSIDLRNTEFEDILAQRLDDLVTGLVENDLCMNIALLQRNKVIDDMRLRLGWGALSGVRAMRSGLFCDMIDECRATGTSITGWEIEAALNTFTRKRHDLSGRKLNRSIGKVLWPDVVNVGSRVKTGSIVGGAARMARIHSGAFGGFLKFAKTF